MPTCRVGRSCVPLRPLAPSPPSTALNQDKETIREYAKASFDKEMEEGRICYRGRAARARARATHAHMHACARAARSTSALHCLHCTALHCTRRMRRWNWGEATIEATTLTFRVGGMRMSRA